MSDRGKLAELQDSGFAPAATNVRTRFDQMFARAQNGEARAKFEINQLLYLECSYIEGHKSLEDFKRASVWRDLAESADGDENNLAAVMYEKRVEDFDDCLHVFSHVPHGTTWHEWGRQLLVEAAEAGDLVAGMQLVDGTNALVGFLDDFPEVLNEKNPYPRMRVFNILASRYEGNVHEDKLFLFSWYLATCVTDDKCLMAKQLQDIEQSDSGYSIQQIMESYLELEGKLQANLPFSESFGWHPTSEC